ncbi:hypothetical protein PF010_g21539 [Phytophthora fragariae]|uniref:Uncharacterized protein n=1 Tax=Phytophthora fragariae TaxID=53985 RepID=A0A6G0KBZ3_9STRA|nr:hypothetical protein PF010_g21539 [Phytophthora fragariae]KAE9192753.1 hypothetical protein PF004_g21209 [Phytophthora fragariae]KAE9304776.1 hypothetical protein PF008_g21886 [Phytophthora fragariae]
MTTEWEFLQPWRLSLLTVLQLPDAVQDTGHIRATLQCWSDALPNDQKFVTPDACSLRVNFPTDPELRSDRESMQRIREALELFDFLAAVDNAAFELLLADYLIVRQPLQEGTERRPHVFWPTWELQLAGTLANGDVVATESSVTWGELFGCPDDPWGSSEAFRAAMTKLRRMKLGRGGNHHNKIATNSWQVFTGTVSDVLLVVSDQKLVREEQRIRPSPWSRALHKLLELQVPHVVQLKAVDDTAKMMATWQSPLCTTVKSKPGETQFVGGLYSESIIPEVAVALARTDMATFKLDNTVDGVLLPEARTNAGFLLSLLICGRSICFPSGNSLPALERTGKCSRWDIPINGISALRFGAIFSAFTEATSIETLVLADNGVYHDPVYWSWLAYVFCSKTSETSVEIMDISLVDVTEQHVVAVEQVAASNYPQPKSESARSRYGYVVIQEGTELRLTGVDGEQGGYGICEVNLLDGVAEFIHDTPAPNIFFTANDTRGVRSLSLTLASVENDSIVPRLLSAIGGGLHTLSLEFKCGGPVGLNLSALASACPELKELRVHNCNVKLGRDREALRAWGIRKLFLWGTQMVRNLPECLSDSAYRMSGELTKLEVSLTRQRLEYNSTWPCQRITVQRYLNRTIGLYKRSLMAHDNDELMLVDAEEFEEIRCALISVVDCGGGKLRAATYLDAFRVISIILTFAAPKSRSVKVTEARVASWRASRVRVIAEVH